MGWVWIVALLASVSALSYHRASLKVWMLALGVFLFITMQLHVISVLTLSFSWMVYLGIFLPLLLSSLRLKMITAPILKFYRQAMPTMSRTEREALSAGTVSWEGDLFKGDPNWDKLLAYSAPMLSYEEQAFIDGPVETLCKMLDDWDITHHRADLPPEVWQYLKDEGFFAFIIPKEYGGKAFSAYAHSRILIKIYGRCTTAGATVAVPNSLGPAELLLHYGTTEQKNYYLPRLARGEDIPCFALTGPEAGSDASSMTDSGVVCWGEFEGKKTLGLRLNFNKRYITLAPVATVIGLAFKMYDPEHLLGDQEDIGITCALIPRNVPGLSIGQRHYPANIVFQNGPIQGNDIFIPLDWIIGGVKMAGQGWRMLMECLAAGRAISLPASGTGGSKVIAYSAGAYARVRRQFNTPIGRFEGIEEVLARIAGLTYTMDAACSFTAAVIDQGAQPAVASAITKYHVTEMGRMATLDALDIFAGKGICIGPKNHIMRFYQSAPISITVEGANILTRCLMIFGQGAMRCHPYVFAEYEAAHLENNREALIAFDKALMGHLSFTFSNFVRTKLLSLTSGRIAKVPNGPLKRYFQLATRYSSAFALLADISLLLLRGSLKRLESISGRLGDILSQLYLLSAILKHYYDQEKQLDDLPIVDYAAQTCLHRIEQSIDEILRNYPIRWMSYLLRIIIFPYGRRNAKPSDQLGHKVAQLLLSPTSARARLTQGAFLTQIEDNMSSLLNDALVKTIQAEPIEKMIKSALQAHQIHGKTLAEQAIEAYNQKVITREQLNILQDAIEARSKIIAVDDFAPEELGRTVLLNTSHEHYEAERSTRES